MAASGQLDVEFCTVMQQLSLGGTQLEICLYVCVVIVIGTVQDSFNCQKAVTVSICWQPSSF